MRRSSRHDWDYPREAPSGGLWELLPNMCSSSLNVVDTVRLISLRAFMAGMFGQQRLCHIRHHSQKLAAGVMARQ